MDWPLLGISRDEEYFVDTAIPFGLCHGASACQRMSEAAGEISAARYGSKMHAYVDDMGGTALDTEADTQYNGLETLSQLGLALAPSKCQAPYTLWCG